MQHASAPQEREWNAIAVALRISCKRNVGNIRTSTFASKHLREYHNFSSSTFQLILQAFSGNYLIVYLLQVVLNLRTTTESKISAAK